MNKIESEIGCCLIFDIDGVLTHPERKESTMPEVLKDIVIRLERNEPIIFNTGRSVDFIRTKIITPLQAFAPNNEIFKNVLVAAEQGAIVVCFDKKGNEQIVADQSISVPVEIQNKARHLIEESYADSMFFDDTKRTMVSVEMRDNYDLAKFHTAQIKLVPDLQKLIFDYDRKSPLVVDPTTIATDIQHPAVGKAFGIQKALEWLREKRLVPREFLAFGDSQSDLPMAEELARQGRSVRFVFVGEPEKLKGTGSLFPIVYTSGRYEAGVAEFLKKL